MTKSAVYTRSGDEGLTSLATGQRIPKTSLRLEAYGTTDELNSWIGVLASSADCPDDVQDHLIHIQNKLFNLGSYLASQPKDGEVVPLYGLTGDDVNDMEQEIDRMDAAVPPFKTFAFILPGGTELAAKAHVARTVCRRAERRVIALAEQENVDPIVIRYINRLSDYLFVAAKYINARAGVPEILWNKQG